MQAGTGKPTSAGDHQSDKAHRYGAEERKQEDAVDQQQRADRGAVAGKGRDPNDGQIGQNAGDDRRERESDHQPAFQTDALRPGE